MKHFTLILSLFILSLTGATAQSSRTAVKAEDYPFVLTTDPEHPALYYIYTGRDGNGEASEMVFVNEIPWGESDYKLQLMYKNPNKAELTQLWYFMEENGKIKIISAADNRMITVANTSDGAQKVYTQTAEERTHAYYLWTLDKTGGYYAFKTSDGKTFLSHNGNWATGKSMMGLYNADGSKDEGSRVFFEACNDVSGIQSATAEKEFKYGIFTITGKRIDKITRPGVYIINGKKRVVR
jgi:hypothetical protein